MKLISKLGGRKFIFAMYAVTLASVLTYLGKLGDIQYAAILCAAIAIFPAANVAQKRFIPAPEGETK